MFVFGLTMGQIESEILHKLWVNFEEDEFGAPKVDEVAFRRYAKIRVDRKINAYLTQIVGVTESLRTFCVITLKVNQGEYLVPDNCSHIQRVLYFNSATDYVELPIKERERLERLVPGWQTNPGTPEYAYPGNWSGTVRKLGLCPAPNVAGTSPTIVDSGIYQVTSPQGSRAAVSGVAGPTSNNMIYVDSEGRDMEDYGIVVGQTIKNVSDGSQGLILDVTTTSITASSLTGGSTNVWTPGNLMELVPVEYGELLITPAQTYLVQATAARMPFPGLTMAAGNIIVEYFALPALLQDAKQYPEMHKLFHQALVFGPAAELAEERPPDSPEFAQSKVYWQRFNESIAGIKAFTGMQYKKSRLVADVRARRRWR